MKILIVAEFISNTLKPSTYSVINAALKISQDIDIIVVGSNIQNSLDELSKVKFVQSIMVVESEQLTYPTAEQIVSIIKPIVSDYQMIMAPSTTFGKNFMPRLAAVLNVGQVSDIVKIESTDTYVRPIYAGNVLQTVQALDDIKIITVRPSAFSNTPELGGNAQIKTIPVTDLPMKSIVTKFAESKSDRPELTAARVVVSGGRGMGSGENFKLLEQLALKLNAAIGASRVAVDSGYVPNDYQVGQTGKVVAPDLYMAFGISGAIQHLAGMKDSKVIVAVNKDPDAPIFQVADYGLIGDLFEIIPELTDKL